MDKYLQQILSEVNTIIIPGLGALTITNKSTGEIMFMGFLKHDDGALAKYICEKEGLAENDAKNMIAKYVRDIQAKLDTGDTYDMYQFGRFVKRNGEIEFEAIGTFTAETESKPAPAEEAPIVEMKPVPAPVAEPEPTPEPAPVPEPTPAPVAEATPEPVKAEEPKAEPAPVDEKTAEPAAPEVPKVDITAIKPDENVYIPEQEVAAIKEQQAKAETPPPAAKPDPKAKAKPAPKAAKPAKAPKPPKDPNAKKRGPVFWILLVLGIIVVLGGGATAVFYQEVKNFISGTKPADKPEDQDSTAMANAETQEQEDAAAKAEELSEETPITEEQPIEEVNTPEPVEETPPPAPEPNMDSGMPYHIIAGGFANESNATRFAEKLKGEGKSASVLGRFDELYLVSAGSYGSQADAAAALKSGGIKGWVFKYPK